MAYQALYRKWRPSDFDGIVGQDAVVTTLKNQIKSDRIGHAYLFCGTRGTGKTSAAKIFARAVNCPHSKEHDGSPCNECEACRAVNEGRAMNVFEIDAASNNGVDNIRDIREQVEYPPVTGRFKVYIIDEVHMLSTGAFNALLKTLEEPPAYVIFILATTDPQKLPATILSRCQRYDFKRISKARIAEHLKAVTEREGVKAEDKALAYVAEAADGSMRDSLSILDQCLAYHYGEILTYDNVLDILGAADDSIYSELFGRIAGHDVEGCLELTARLINDGCETGRIINDLIMYLRNVLLVKSMGSNELLELSEERFERAGRDAQKTDNDTLIRIISSLAELSNRTRFTPQKRTAFEVELIRLCTAGMPGYGSGIVAGAESLYGSVGRIAASAQSSSGIAAMAGIAASSGAGMYAAGNAQAAHPAGGQRDYRAAGGNVPEAAAGSARISIALTEAAASGSDSIEGTQNESASEAAGKAQAGLLPSGKAAADGRNGTAAAKPAASGTEDTVKQRNTAELAAAAASSLSGGSGAESHAQPQPQPGALYSTIMQNWSVLMSGLSASNRPLFRDILVKEENNAIVLVFKNQMNYRFAAKNAEENGVVKLRELAMEKLGLKVNFMARVAKPGEISTEQPKATQEELARINFPISIED